MNKWFKALLSLILSLVLILTAMPAFAADSEEHLLEPDVIIAKTRTPYYPFFPAIVNVPAEVYGGTEPNGKLLVAFYKNTVHSTPSEEYPFGTICLVESTDNGLTWSEPVEILSSDILLSYGIGTEEFPVEPRDPNFALLNDGTVLLTFFTRRYATDRYLRVYICESRDGGKTWSVPQEVISNDLDAWLAKRGDIAVFEDDEILVPVYGGTTSDTSSTVRLIRGVRGGNGKWIWTEEISIAPKEQVGSLSELSLIYVGNDTVYGLARPTGHYFVSYDKGKTWQVLGIQEPLSQPGFIRIDENRILATWAKPSTPRYIYGKMIYLNEGFDWNSTDEKLIYTGGPSLRDMADPSAMLTNDNRILTIYYDTRIRAIGGTFTEISDWEIPDMFDTMAPMIALEDNFESFTAGDSYVNDALIVDNQGTSTALIAEEEGNKYLSLESIYEEENKSVSITSVDQVLESCSLEFDFRFNDNVMANNGKEGLAISFSHEKGNTETLIRPDTIQQIYNGTVQKAIVKNLEKDIWYSARIMMLGNRIYAKIAPKGLLPISGWDYIYTSSEVQTERNKLRLEFTAGETGASRVDIDNLRLVYGYTMSIAESEINTYLGDSGVQLTLTFNPVPIFIPPVVWNSSNPEVANVVNGYVTFVGKGTAVITASIGNVMDSCVVTVTEPPSELEGTGDQLQLFTDDFENYETDEVYNNENILITQSATNTAIIKEEEGNKYLQLSGSKPATITVRDFEKDLIGALPAGMTGNQATVQMEEGSNNKVLQIYDQSSSSIADVLYITGLTPTQRLDIDFRLYVENLKATNNVAFKVLNGEHTSASTAFWIRFTTDGGIQYYDGTAYKNVIDGTISINADKWHDIHVECFNTDATTGEAHIYIDGKYAGKALKTSQNGYGTNTANGVNGIYFLSNGRSSIDECFYIDDLLIAEPGSFSINADYHTVISGNYTNKFDFRFPQDSAVKLQISMLHKNKSNIAILSQKGIAIMDGTSRAAESNKNFEANQWYTWKSIRIGNSLFIKTWKKDQQEPAVWDVVYHDKSASVDDTFFRFTYLPSSETPELLDIDNFAIYKSVRINMSQETLTSMPNSTPVQLSVIVDPPITLPAITWTSSNPGVATVDENGFVSFHGVGNATITATLWNISCTCEVSVQEPVLADYSEVDAAIAEAAELVENDYTVGSWKYLQAVIDSVERGKLASEQNIVDGYAQSIRDAISSLVFAGQAALDEAKAQAMALNKDDYFDVSWNILVQALAMPETSNEEVIQKTAAILNAINALEPHRPYTIVLNHTYLSLPLGSFPVLLTATFEPELPVNLNITWSSDNDAVASVDQTGLVTVKGKGATLIRAKTSDQEAYCIVSVYEPYVSPPVIYIPDFGQDKKQDKVEDKDLGSKLTYDSPKREGDTTRIKAEVEATVKDGLAAALISEEDFIEVAEEVLNAAAKSGTSAFMEIKIASPDNSTEVEVVVPKKGLDVIADGNIDTLKITTSVAEVSFDSKAVSAISASASEPVSISVSSVDKADLKPEVQEVVGDRPIYDFTITSGDKVISDLGGGTATISIPYTPKAGEDLNAIVIYHITDEGELVLIAGCVYDAETGTLTFKLSHFSRYTVGYNKVEFTDTEGSWAKDYITYLSARNIISGDGTGRYLPGNNITRAEFTKILAGIAGIDTAKYKTSAFQDVDENAWYAPYVAWATENGIVKGYGNGLFGPDDYITREQIALMISRFASVQNYTLPETAEAIEFADSDKISSYAREAVEKVQRAGIINGRPSGDHIVFAPLDNADRAEAAKMVAILMQNMVK